MKKVLLYVAAFLLGTSSLLVLVTGHVAAATSTWDGGGSDNNMNTAQNWVGDTVPSAGADLVFPAGAARKTVVNDFTAGTSFASISFTGTTTPVDTNYNISGNAIALTDGITTDFDGYGGAPTISLAMTLSAVTFLTSADNNLTVSGDLAIGSNTEIFDGAGLVTVSGTITGSGTVDKDGIGTLSLAGANTSFSGPITGGMGVLIVGDKDALGTTGGATTMSSGTRLEIGLPQSQKTATIAEPITLHSETYDPGSGDPLGVLAINATCSLSYCNDSDITLSGTLTITTDVRIDAEATARLTGTISGAHTLKLSDGAYGTLVINSGSNGSSTANGTYEAPIVTKTYSTNDPSQQVYIYKNVTALVTGTVGAVYVQQYGTLKGTGTVGAITLYDGGVIAPGASPGILNSGDVVFTGGRFDEELGGTGSGEYDQLNVTGAVHLNTTTDLRVSMYNDYSPAVGSSFTIINNDGSDAVDGHFAGLTEGATFTAGNHLFKITYRGGDGNDVVLTVVPTPSAPDTGFEHLRTNPLLALTLLCVVTPLLVVAARRSAKSTVR